MEKLRGVSVSYFLVLMITLMLSRIFSEAIMFISDKHSLKLSQKLSLRLCYIASKTF